MDEHELREAVLSGIPANRLADLGSRARAGELTSLEALALSVVRGGTSGEEATPALLDEALATYCHGSYRVPVRVVSDWRRVRVVVTPTECTDAEAGQRVAEQISQLLKEPGRVIVVPAGWRVEVYETENRDEPVVVKEPNET